MSGKKRQWGKLRNLTKELLYELYITTGKSTVEISKIFDCDSAAINRKLRKLGIPIRSNSEAHRGLPPWNKGKKCLQSISKKIGKDI